MVTRKDANRRVYGAVSAREILGGSVPQPVEAGELYRMLDLKFKDLGTK